MMVVSFITKNSAERLLLSNITLNEVLNSTLQIPYETLILVDDSSRESETVRFFEGWCDLNGKELIVSRSRHFWRGNPTRATARQTAIDIFFENFDDEFLMFIDDDVVLRDGWWRWVEDNKVLDDEGVGEVWGINWDTTSERKNLLKLCGKDLKNYLIDKFHERGGTHDTIYRRKAIEGISIPPELHVYEDSYIHHWVICAGWKSIVNPVGALHYAPGSASAEIENMEKLKDSTMTAIRYGVYERESLKKYSSSVFMRLVGYLSLIRPIMGFVPMLLSSVQVRGFGIKTLIRVYREQYLKIWAKWQLLRNSDKFVNSLKH